MKEYFKKINTPSISVTKYFTEDRISKLDWLDVPGLHGLESPRPVYMREPFYQALDKKFGITGCAILKFEPMISYCWHNDSDRNSTVNLLINTGHSHTMFGNRKSEWHMEIVELDYEPDHFYLFNTQEPHEVINLSDTRYLFTTRIAADPTYKELVEWAGGEGWT